MATPVLTKEAAEKTARSIFVGNIPYEATEEKLIELFGKAGPVIGFRLVYDRESGKPKGYGFCEYNNPAIAASALRNLQNIEFNGRPLRIGPAAGEQNSAELALSNPAVGPPLESPYGDSIDPQGAPEAISRAVASLPPEQMYELMKQMKLCIQNNPNEARNMLLQNPQLAYALLQAQIVMKIVDPKVAIAMLNRSHDQIPPAMPDEDMTPKGPPMTFPGHLNQPQPPMGPNPPGNHMMPLSSPGAHLPPSGFPHHGGPAPVPHPNHFGVDQHPPRSQAPQGVPQKFYPPNMPPNGYPSNSAAPPPQPPFDYPPGQAQPPNMSGQQSHFNPNPPPVRPPPPQITPAVAAAAAASMGPNSLLAGQGEQEKVTLIMQVLQLSDEQLTLLPEDQRRSIMILKEQLGKTGAI
ncbi:unnamed protein product [Trichobilharzia szidati]|nr:unnamed protein product [Trichobilharzia szidati]